MSDSDEIRIKIDPPKGHHAQLSDFSNVCATLRSCLTHIGRCIGSTATFAISDLSCGSAILAVAPVDKNNDVAQTFNKTIHSLETGKAVDSRLDFAALKSFNGFCAAINNENVRISVAGLRLTKSYSANLSHLLEPQSPALGSVSGRLEAVSVHGCNKFTLYTPLAGEEVDCRFDSSDLRDVLDAVGHGVTVFGTLYYARTKTFPVRVDVDSFEVTPNDSVFASLLDARGSLAGDPQSALDSQRAMRNEWN